MSRAKKARTGPESTLTSDVMSKLRDYVLQGKEVPEMSKLLDIPHNTLYTWKSKNYLNLQSEWNIWETQRMLQQAEKFSDKLMAMVTTNPDGSINKGLIAIQQKESEFLREKLLIARDKYNSGNVVNVNVALPQPIIDLSKVVSTVEPRKELDK